MQKEHVQVLLASTPDTPVQEIEEQLEQTIGMDCHLFQCADLDSCLTRIQSKDPHFDIILLDLMLVNEKDSERFLSGIHNAARDTPIVAFTREEDRDLALFMVAEGASILSNRRELRLDTKRLREVMEHSWIRHKMSRKRAEQHETALEAERAEGVQNLAAEKKRGADRLKEKDQIISWMGGGYSVDHPPEKNT